MGYTLKLVGSCLLLVDGHDSVGVDKIIRIYLSTEGPVSPYKHETLS